MAIRSVVVALLVAGALVVAGACGQEGPPVPKVGSLVAAPWGGFGSLYHGTVQAIAGDTADVLYTDDKVVRKVKLVELRVVKARKWKVGDAVKAVYSSGKFYDGTITADKGTAYTVKWNDGSSPRDVPPDKIMAP
jgi:hypothetical protein